MIDVSKFEGHTPSPWKFKANPRTEFITDYRIEQGCNNNSERFSFITTSTHVDIGVSPDMRLIESAPELLKELILAREEIVYLRKSIEWHCDLRMKAKLNSGDGGMIALPCVWVNDGFEKSDSVTTLCSKQPYFEDDVTKEYLDSMGYKYCPYCGKEILLHRDSAETGKDDFMAEEDY